MCFPSNLGEHLSIDETSFSNGELYTIVTNKDGHGKKGSLIAMIKGTKSDDVCRWLLRKLPVGKRRKVKTITLDMSGSMSRIAKKCFPLAKQIIDRFHVQKEFKDALQDLRIQYRWQAMEAENKEIRKCKKERTEFKAEIFSNGDTRKQLLARSRYLLFKNPDKWSVSQRQRAEILFEQYDDIKQFYYLSLRLGQIYSCNSKKDEARVNMALWGSVTILGDLTIHANNFATLNKKNFTSATPLKLALNFLILALNDSAFAFVSLSSKKLRILS